MCLTWPGEQVVGCPVRNGFCYTCVCRRVNLGCLPPPPPPPNHAVNLTPCLKLREKFTSLLFMTVDIAVTVLSIR